jgi:hypothetical protein
MREELARLNEKRKGRGEPPLMIGMGVHIGPAISGTIGSEERLEYTVIGDTVNMASRIEASTKAFGADLLLSEPLAERVKDRFLSKNELSSLSPTPSLEELYYYWCSKEALYKLHGLPGVDFRNDIRIHPFDYLCTTNKRGRGSLLIQGSVEDYSIYHACLGELMVVVVC